MSQARELTDADIDGMLVPVRQAIALVTRERERANLQACELYAEIDDLRAQLVEHGIEPRERERAPAIH